VSVQDTLSLTQERHRREILEFQHKYDACLARYVYKQKDRVTEPTMEQCIVDGQRRGLQPVDTIQLSKTNGTLSTDDTMAHDELGKETTSLPDSVDVALNYTDRPVRQSILHPWIRVVFVYCLPSWLESFVSSAEQWACQLLA